MSRGQCVYNGNIEAPMCVPEDPVNYICRRGFRTLDPENGVFICYGGTKITRPVNPDNTPIGDRGDYCAESFECGRPVNQRRLGDGPWSEDDYVEGEGQVDPLCRISSGPDAGKVVYCIGQDIRDDRKGQIVCANMATSDDGECMYCPPGDTVCDRFIPLDPDASDGAPLSAFRMRTRMSMARFY